MCDAGDRPRPDGKCRPHFKLPSYYFYERVESTLRDPSGISLIYILYQNGFSLPLNRESGSP